ncbi:hypothetical protein [Kineobactrum salinum]|uniref:Uncharacterized protein n=1 Tax=Kineobactrum salinum TaxID=2708301 RepID=A0A6C0TY71_9GAMM|nr:hypothetical protein [Kineobactrum salinum]QIB64716.1 hypothetical protein G3T16_04230 [Kineobactrum salinum]
MNDQESGWVVPRLEAQRVLDSLQSPVQSVAGYTTLEVLQQQARDRTAYQAYHAVPELKHTLTGIVERFGEPARMQMMQALLASFIRDFNAEELPFRITEDVQALYQQSFMRILAAPAGHWQIDDIFFKDLALVSGYLFPAGERVIEPFSALQRSLALTGGARQGWRFVRACLAAGGNRPVFRLHVHLSEAPSLSAQSWRLTCIRLARMLRINPGIKGIAGAAWFYDPAVVQVSPHLHFINDMLAGQGASWFFSHIEGENSGALISSTTRQQAYAAGRYVPRNYSMFWPRRCALRWLETQQVEP